jgi:hypothetical protein
VTGGYIGKIKIIAKFQRKNFILKYAENNCHHTSNLRTTPSYDFTCFFKGLFLRQSYRRQSRRRMKYFQRDAAKDEPQS